MLSLSDMQDIVLPASPPLWPPAPGFWVMLALLVVLIVSLLRWRRRARRRNAYRKAGAALLASAGTVHEVSVTLKRVALAAWPRETVASLHDAEWAGFLNDTCQQCNFEAGVWKNGSEAADRALIENASIWIRKHTRAATGNVPDV